ncbi:VTT domain-containing protein [Streptomyces sp. TRM66268-LWL]|uniref:VTT domain-containing protein n=1 Tax=Streptomyces polyasparticus TaxID=2767826 RepID=A0ABR7SID4_9ACTN|nr:VTT domain-containing protein [Streptomyces polyasparticus]MBC9715237.1 VTT domain-containing protein [Streptomyces polyasparticus]
MGEILFTAAGLYVLVLLRAGGTFALGRLAGAGARRGRFAERLSTPRFQRVERAIQRWGAPVVAVSFLTIGFQTAANFLAGTLRMPLRRYLPALFLGGAAWALLYATAGIGALKVLSKLFTEHTALGVTAVAVLLLGALGVLAYRRRSAAAGDSTPATES